VADMCINYKEFRIENVNYDWFYLIGSLQSH